MDWLHLMWQHTLEDQRSVGFVLPILWGSLALAYGVGFFLFIGGLFLTWWDR